MTVRIGWDEYEVALLIDACNRIRDNKIDKAECVHKLSNLLRQRAKANGINIDEVFRNENGIALQMTKMEYLLTDGKKGLPGARACLKNKSCQNIYSFTLFHVKIKKKGC